MSASDGPRRPSRTGLAVRVLRRLLPDDAWSQEFLDEIEDDRGRLLLNPRTWRFVWMMRRRRRREMRQGGGGLGDVGMDLRHALRLVVREPRTAVFIAATLALGIGSLSAMYGVSDRLFLRGPIGVSEHRELVRLYLTVDDGGGVRSSPWIPYRTARAIQERVSGLETATLYRFEDRLARFGPDVGPVRLSAVDGHHFRTLGVSPAAGRFFDEGAPAGEGAPAVVSHALAVSAYGGASAAVGRSIDLGGVQHSVVAVAPDGFAGAHLERVDVWIPIDEDRAGFRNWWFLGRVAGLDASAGVPEGLLSEVEAVHVATDPGRSFQWAVGATVSMAPVTADDAGSESAEAAVARLLLAVVGLVLLIACANVVNLLLARLTRRQGELVVRLALGSGRWRLARLLVAESLILGMAGGLLSVPVAYVGGSVLRSVLLPQVAWTSSPVDAGVLVVATALAVLTGVVLGALSAWPVGGTDLVSGLSSTRHSAGRPRQRAQVGLATLQIALSAALLLCAGLFLRSFWTLQATDLGLAADDVLAVKLRSLDPGALGDGQDDEDRVYRLALDRVRAQPAFEGAALVVGLPFVSRFGLSVYIPGRDSIPEVPGGGPWISAVTDDYFATLGTRILQGEGITSAHLADGARVAVVSETMATTIWPNGSPLGSCIRIGPPDAECATVVGIAEDVHIIGYREPPSMQMYVPFGTNDAFSGTHLVARLRGGGGAADRLRSALATIDPAVHYVDVTPLATVLEPQRRPWALGAVVLSTASVIALLVSLLGVYGVLSYLVAQRRREIGVRMALGANGRRVRELVLRTGAFAGALGVTVGFLSVVAGSRWLEPLLFETRVADPAVMTVVGTLLLAAAVAACIVPAVSASRIAPVECLRSE